MKAKLIAMTPDPINVMWVAAKTCYASESPLYLWDKREWNEISDRNQIAYSTFGKAWKLVKQVLDSGHLSIAEHVTLTFAIEGISRACSHQLVRHRHCTFSQQSQRYVEIKEDRQYVRELLRKSNEMYFNRLNKDGKESREEFFKECCKLVDKYFVCPDDKIGKIEYLFTLEQYLKAIESGCKPEDARSLLPNATKTSIVMTLNYRQLMHICNLRLCTRAQSEIRQLFKEIVSQVKAKEPELAEYLVPQCEINGFCTEHKCCGRKPHISTLLPAKEPI